MLPWSRAKMPEGLVKSKSQGRKYLNCVQFKGVPGFHVDSSEEKESFLNQSLANTKIHSVTPQNPSFKGKIN